MSKPGTTTTVRVVGIDLGTTNSAVAIADKTRPRVLDNREGRPLTPSIVSLKKPKRAGDAAQLLVGETAAANWPMAPEETIVSVKRLMGRGLAEFEVERMRNWALYPIVEPSGGTKDSVRVVLGGKQHSPAEISAMILKKLKEDAEYRLGEAVTYAVITVPAYFSQAQHEATFKAGLLAGLKVVKIINEPTAAAIAFGMEATDGATKTLLVYDLGGGTFDISVLVWANGAFACLDIEGDMWLGGDNLDQVLVDYVLAQVQRDYGLDARSNKRFMAVLHQEARNAKERLGGMKSTSITVTGVLKDAQQNLIDVDVEVTRDWFERHIRPLVATFKACPCGEPNGPESAACAVCKAALAGAVVQDGKAIQKIHEALKNSKQSVEQIDTVIMAGSSTNVPLVQEAVEKLFGRQKLQRQIHPKLAVAFGAAILGARLGPKVVCPNIKCGHVNPPDAVKCESPACGHALLLEEELSDPEDPDDVKLQGLPGSGGIAPYHYGMESDHNTFNIFVEKNERYPTEHPRTQTFTIKMANQRIIRFPIYGGMNMEQARANKHEGDMFAVLPPALPAGTPVRVTIWLNHNGIFALKASLEDGTELKPWMLKGEEDAGALEVLHKAEQELAGKGSRVSPEEQRKLEESRNRVLDALNKKEHEHARRQAQQMQQQVNDAGQGKPEESANDPFGDAQLWAQYLEWITNEFVWALPPHEHIALTQLVRQTYQAVEQRDQAALPAKVQAIRQALERLPELVRLLLGIRQTISQRFQSTDPVLASKLFGLLEQVENAFKTRDPQAQARFGQLIQELEQALKGAVERGELKCSKGDTMKPGQWVCEVCGEDMRVPRSGLPGKV